MPTTRKLVIVRESALYDYQLLSSMIRQTVWRHREELGPGAEQVLEWGIQPFLGPVDGLTVHRIREGRCRAVLFEHQDVNYLFSEGSAASWSDERGMNSFCTVIGNVVQEVRPTIVYAARFDRLVRSLAFMSDVYKSFISCRVRELVLDKTRIPVFGGDGREAIEWSLYGLMAHQERVLILERLTAGKIDKFLRGAWIGSRDALPVGYRLVAGRPEIDEDRVEAVRGMLHLLGDRSLSNREVVNRVGALGLTSRRIQQRLGTNATYADVANPTSAVETLAGHIESYVTGVLVARVPNHLHVQTGEIAGVPIVRRATAEPDDDAFGDPDHGELVCRYEVGVPDGGWAEQEVLDAVRGRVRAMRSGGARGGQAAHSTRRPLQSQPPWVDSDGREARLYPVAGVYQIRARRPVVSQYAEHREAWLKNRDDDEAAEGGQRVTSEAAPSEVDRRA